MMLKSFKLKTAFCLTFATLSIAALAQPNGLVKGRLFFLGVTNDSSRSVWLSLTTAGSFKLEAQGQQLIDSWSLSRRGSHLSLSPIVSQGNGGTHFLINAVNNKKLDSQNQNGGIVFPPFPSEPPIITNPIPPIPGHPIVIPPGTPPIITNPIPPVPGHPIVIPPGTPSNPIPPGSSQPPVAGVPPSAGISSGAGSQSAQPSGSQPAAQSTQKNEQGLKKAPLTEARQFDQESKWNIWSDNRYFDLNDDRHSIDAKGETANFTVGADRLITQHAAIGMLLSAIKFRHHALDGLLKNRARGYNVGPYFATNISSKWSLDGAFTYGQFKNNNELATLNSHYKTTLLSGALHATGLYTFGAFQLLPKPLISYTHFRNPSYQLNGVVQNYAFQINRAANTFNFAYVEFRLEGNYTAQTKRGNIIQPYAEAGVDYIFVHPNGGKTLTSNLTLASVPQYTATMTAGVRAFLAKAFLIDASGSYLSLGQAKLNVWEARLLLSYSFN